MSINVHSWKKAWTEYEQIVVCVYPIWEHLKMFRWLKCACKDLRDHNAASVFLNVKVLCRHVSDVLLQHTTAYKHRFFMCHINKYKWLEALGSNIYFIKNAEKNCNSTIFFFHLFEAIKGHLYFWPLGVTVAPGNCQSLGRNLKRSHPLLCWRLLKAPLKQDKSGDFTLNGLICPEFIQTPSW